MYEHVDPRIAALSEIFNFSVQWIVGGADEPHPP